MTYWKILPAMMLAAGVALGQVTPDPALSKNRNTYSPVMEYLKARRTPASDAQLDELKTFPFEAIWGTVKGLGYNTYWTGLKPTRPEARVVGRALTMRYLPRRPDLDEAVKTLAKQGDWPEYYNVRAAEEAKPGDVLVVDLGGSITTGVFFGDISALGAQLAGARGAVLYGSTRDLGELKDMKDFPVFASGFDPNPALQVGVEWNIPIRVGEATVLPGDVVVVEEEAVVFFPPELTTKVVEGARKIVEKEIFERKTARLKKYRFRDVYPLSPELQKQFEEEKAQKKQ